MIILVMNVAQWNRKQMASFSRAVSLANVTNSKLFQTIRELGGQFVKTKSNPTLNKKKYVSILGLKQSCKRGA